jgi:hypothetical protein
MGLLVDRLADTLGRLRQLQAQLVHRGNPVEAAHLQHNTVERLQQVVLQIDGSSADDRAERLEAAIEAAKSRFPRSRGGKGIKKKGRRKPGRLVWICCGEPRRSVSRKGKPIWVAACSWKKGKRKGQTLRMVGQGTSKPQSITLKGRKMKRCQKPATPSAPKK